ncbi:DUF1287 domain-containing protein [Psychroflexus halocasei]|uniref:DUF1287 domain-containing protein n=1 Tax=Psychroflexus halocasei TaxID=908615 RepID=A0A1H4B2R7_9FLAO|nr:DUF1287 domain-containing protein [Psychroflexus halocasei]SEA42377.1 hypothetical protein SAMN05421540_105241 [Psychroflexus halocasei]
MKALFLFIIFTFSVVIYSQTENSVKTLSDHAIELIDEEVIYDPSYFSIDYPNGDVPDGKGVCTDVIIRVYRQMNIDLQKLVHEDMKANFKDYPQIWGLNTTDKNIDHRRVPNLMRFFKRMNTELPITNNPDDYKPGHVVAWRLNNGMTHIGIVVDLKSNDGKRSLIVHNIGAGQVVEDCLFDFKIIGHYNYK